MTFEQGAIDTALLGAYHYAKKSPGDIRFCKRRRLKRDVNMKTELIYSQTPLYANLIKCTRK